MKGSRAMWLVAGVLLAAAVLAWVLKDGGIFTATTNTSLIGKFLYDGARDVTEMKSKGGIDA